MPHSLQPPQAGAQTTQAAEKILVLGASGFIGSNLVPALVAAGYPVRAASRSLAPLKKRHWPQVELCEADVLKPSSLQSALVGVDTVFYLVHAMDASEAEYARERQGAENVVSAARRCGVRRIIYLGALQRDDSDSLHLRARKATGEVLRQSGIPTTEVRSPIIVGPGSAAFEVMRDALYNLPLLLLPRWVSSKMAPIALDNLLFYLLKILEHPELTQDQQFDVAGPQMLSYQEQLQQLGQLLGLKRRFLVTRWLSLRLAQWGLQVVTSVPHGIASALLTGVKQDLPASDDAIRQLFPQPLQSYRQAARHALQQELKQFAAGQQHIAPVLLRRWKPNYGYYAKRAGSEGLIQASAADVWQLLCQIGAEPRYFAMEPLWATREWIDGIVGGNGRHRYRRHPTALALGDRVDSWQVIEYEPERKLTLMFGMKAPGVGGLTFRLLPQNAEYTRLAITAWWHPAGFWGLLYWFAMMPAHLLIFRRMVSNIDKRLKPTVVKAIR